MGKPWGLIDIVFLLLMALSLIVLVVFFREYAVSFLALGCVPTLDTYLKHKLDFGIETAPADIILACTLFVVGLVISQLAGESGVGVAASVGPEYFLVAFAFFLCWLAVLLLCARAARQQDKRAWSMAIGIAVVVMVGAVYIREWL